MRLNEVIPARQRNNRKCSEGFGASEKSNRKTGTDDPLSRADVEQNPPEQTASKKAAARY